MSKYILNGVNGNVGKQLQLEFTDYSEYSKSFQVTNEKIFIHLASKSNASWKNIIDSNINYLREIIEFCKTNSIKKIIFFSAISIYTHNNLYSISKLLGEKILEESGLKVLVLRLPMILTQDTQNGILNRIANQLQNNEDIILYNSELQFNNFISVKDIYNFIKNYKFENKFEIVDLGTSEDLTLFEIVTFMKFFLSSKSKLKLQKRDIPLMKIDLTKAIYQYKYQPIETKKILKQWLKKRYK